MKRESIAEQLQHQTGPIDRVARRVIKKASPENLWEPKLTLQEHHRFSKEVLPTIPVPANCQGVSRVIGARRGRMVVFGFSAEQNPRKNAKWVVRCDCGNFERRCRILKWLGTEGDDMCIECHKRVGVISGHPNSALPPGDRATTRMRDLSVKDRISAVLGLKRSER